jgi:WD40 repeat protein
MKRIASVIFGLLIPFSKSQIIRPLILILLAMPLTALAGLFGFGEDHKVATEVAALDEGTLPGPIDFSPDGRHLAVDSWGNGGTDIWDLDQRRIVRHVPEGGAGTWFKDLISYSPNGQQLAICHGAGPSQVSIDVYDTSTWTKVHSIGDAEDKEWMGGGCAGISFTPDGKELIRLANRSLDHPGNNVMFYDTSSWQVTRGIRTIPLGKFNSHRLDSSNWSFFTTPDMILTDPSNNSVFHPSTLSISKDGKYLALTGMSYATHQNGGAQAIVIVVDISNHALVRAISGQAESPKLEMPVESQSIDWNPDNIHIAFGPIDNNVAIKIFDSSNNTTVVSEEAGPSNSLVRYTPDGKYLIEKVGKKVEIWDGQHQTLLQVIKAEPSYIAVSRDGHYFAMGGAENSILDATMMLSLITHPNGPKGKILVYKLQ